jgi:hypothetical protein
MSLGDLCDRISDQEFAMWMAYDRYVQPIGDQRVARQLALLAAMYGNAHSDRRQPFDVDDFDLYQPQRRLTKAEEEQRFINSLRGAGLLIDRSN